MTGPPAHLEIRALGDLSVMVDGDALPASALRGRPGDLLALLVAARDRVLPAEALCDAVWPDAGPAGVNNVHHFVSVLRDRLEPGRAPRAASRYIRTVGSGYRLDLDRVSVDADRFAAHTAAGLEALDAGDERLAHRELAIASALLRGDLLAGHELPVWAEYERERLRSLAGDVLRALALLAERRGDRAAATDHLERLLERDPLDEDVHAWLARLAAEAGDRPLAERRLARWRAAARTSGGDVPDVTVADLLGRSVSGRSSPSDGRSAGGPADP